MAIKINANMSNENKQLLVAWIPRLVKCFAPYNCKINVLEAYVGKTFIQFIVEDLNKTRFNEFMMEKLTEAINTEFDSKCTEVYADPDGRDYILGVQIPQKKREYVSFSKLIASEEFTKGAQYTFVVGENVKNQVICCDMTKEKSVLIGGMTSAGKTVFLHSMICSLLMKNNADTLKLVLFDKNKVFKDYLDLPNILFHGAIFDDYGAKEVYEWIKGELEWRKMLFQRNGCRNLEEYNRYAKISGDDSFPAVFTVIDELSDWVDNEEIVKMLFETLSMKQLAEHGLFFAVATQKPSIDYLGASLKELFPAKIVFKFDYPINSRILLGKTSATKLQSDGDMFYRNVETRKIARLQAPFITREDIMDTLAKYDIRLED
ncbi:MAG: FtsK/SpoIIIE domain-containing protein [Clostridia bacterium]|nr:FtsK/SpoIIIE domain-containing protein [Clostridia bacterium]